MTNKELKQPITFFTDHTIWLRDCISLVTLNSSFISNYLPVKTKLDLLEAFYTYTKELVKNLDCHIEYTEGTDLDYLICNGCCNIYLTKDQYIQQFKNKYTISPDPDAFNDCNYTYDNFEEFLKDASFNLGDYIDEKLEFWEGKQQENFLRTFKAIEKASKETYEAYKHLTDKEVLEELYKD